MPLCPLAPWDPAARASWPSLEYPRLSLDLELLHWVFLLLPPVWGMVFPQKYTWPTLLSFTSLLTYYLLSEAFSGPLPALVPLYPALHFPAYLSPSNILYDVLSSNVCLLAPVSPARDVSTLFADVFLVPRMCPT